jgi:cell division protein FtsX
MTFGTNFDAVKRVASVPMATLFTITLELALPGLLLLLWRAAERADREIGALAQRRVAGTPTLRDPMLPDTHHPRAHTTCAVMR